MSSSQQALAARFRELNRAGRLLVPNAWGFRMRIGEELHQHGTWRSIEETFYGFGEAEALFSR